MSARDELDQFDKTWQSHVEWRNGTARTYSVVLNPLGGEGEIRTSTPGRYVSDDMCRRVGETGVLLGGMPTELRRAVLADLEATIGALVDAKKNAIRAQLVEAAKEEARRTLEELGGTPAVVTRADESANGPYPIKLVVHGGQLADPNHDHECG